MSTSSNKKIIIAALLGCFATQGAFAQTIEELAAAARAKKVAELTGGAPIHGNAGLAGFPANPNENNPAIGNLDGAKKSNMSSAPYLIAIYGIENNLVAELTDDGVLGKFSVSDKTPSGWTVTAIGKHSVDLKKYSKSEKVIASKTLRFWKSPDDGFDGSQFASPVRYENRRPVPMPAQVIGGM